MTPATGATIKKIHPQKQIFQPLWQRIILLSVLGYEAAGCLAGGVMLIIAPNGRLMNMPVEIMHGTFRDFLIPGIILFGLGILNTFAFISVLRRKRSDWFMACLALGGMYIWFVVEIIILQELHWLHAMWGIPVLVGWMVAIPLIVLRHNTVKTRKALLICGILSSLLYIAMNIFIPMFYEGYSMLSQAPSELSAIGAPTQVLWTLVGTLYPLLYSAFGWGVLQTAGGKRSLLIAGISILIYSVLSIFWPPMHKREVIAAGGGTLTDTLHVVWAAMTLLFMILLMGFGAAALGKKFRIFTIVTFVIFMVFGILTFMESPNLDANLPTPLMGLWERINIFASMLWVIVFAVILLRRENNADSLDAEIRN